MVAIIHYLPLLTTILSAAFFIILIQAWLERRTGPHLLWWAAGVFFYGLGTAIESAITLSGNTVPLNKAWYIAGALLGGYPLAQGAVYLLANRKLANLLTAITVPFIVLTSVLVILSPVDIAALDIHRPSGAILQWRWVRLMTPFINLYAATFLIGGAIVSARRYAKSGEFPERVRGNVLIAIGGILPGIGGSMAKAGLVEALYVGELIGLVLIWMGYSVIASRRQATAVDRELSAVERGACR
ncbi:MAG TPA: hypothetical protein VJ835_04915 [Fimbriimonadaceae bacterium]|nr:hypothetical protein [Fimbriimonadaceae bacterium]